MKPQTRKDSPGVAIPPPFIYLAAFGASWGLNTLWSVSLMPAPLADPARHIAKAFLILGCLPLFAGIANFVRYRTAISPDSRATTLITGGPYRFSRNPIYLGFTLLYLGAILRSNIAWAVVGLLGVLWVMNRFVIAREEEHLNAVFGDAYAKYCRQVRRWL